MRLIRPLRHALLGVSAVALTASLAACSGSMDSMDDSGSTDQGSSQTMDDSAMSDGGSDASSGMDQMMQTGTFAGANDKMVSGTATIEDGRVMLSDFSSDEGPDLHLYLTNGDDEMAVDSGMELGTVAADEADQSFSVDGVDLSQYDHVVVHCDKAKAVFGSAALS